jgi:hypothetical protein
MRKHLTISEPSPSRASGSQAGVQMGVSARKWLGASLMSTLALGLAHSFAAEQPAANTQIVFTDSSAAILKADLATPSPAVIASGSKLVRPFGIAVGQSGEFFVSDTGCAAILGVDPATTEQRVVSRGGMLGLPLGIAFERSGMLLVANAQALLRIDPQTGAQALVSSQGFFNAPLGVTVAENGDIYVVDALGPVIRVDPKTGVQTLIASGGYLRRPQGIAVRANDIYVSDVATADMNFGIGRIIHINIRTGEQSVLSEGGLLVGPVGIALQANGNLIVGDPYTINPDSADLFDGAIIGLDKTSGAQTLIARGSENFVNPRCVAILEAGVAAEAP